MGQIKRIMPIYSGDVSGVPSALYELGGMVVIHDASGCNSTYNTHDELRWYDKESLVYISGMTELDAVFGDDSRLIDNIIETALELKPSFIAIAGTPIPFINGTDFNGICKTIERKTNIKTFFVSTNGMHTYIKGVGNAFLKLAETFLGNDKKVQQKTISKSVNILGVTPLDFALSTFSHSLKGLLNENGFKVISNWAMDSSLNEIKEAWKAEVNLVVSTTGYKVAKFMEERFNIPYVVGIPIGQSSFKVIRDLKRTAESRKSKISYSDRKTINNSHIVIAGETVVSESLAHAIYEKYGILPKVLCTVETEKGLLLNGDVLADREDVLEKNLKDAQIVIGDPLLKYNCPKQVEFYELPHVACSGRMYAERMPDLIYELL